MNTPKDSTPEGYVSEAKYAELMALYQAALASVSEKDEQLMTEQILRKELVERQFAEYKTGLEAQFDESRRKLTETMERTWEGLMQQFESKVQERVDVEIHKAQSDFYALIKSGIDLFKGLYSKEKDPLLIEQYLKSFDKIAAEANASMAEGVKKSIESVARKALSKNQQIDSLVRMVFLQKSEKHLFDDGIKYADSIADRLGLTDEVREQARAARAFLKEYYAKVQAEKILLDQGNNKSSHGKSKIPENLIRLEPEYLYPDEYLENPDLYEKIGEDRKEWVVIRNLSAVVRVMIRPVLRLKSDKESHPIQHAMVESPIWKSDAAPETLAVMEYNKYGLHLPYYRFVKMLKDAGWSVNRSTINGWHVSVCDLLEPLYDTLRQEVMSARFLAGDGSPMPVIDNEKHKTVKHYVVVFRDLLTNIPVFLTTPGGSRRKEVIQGYLADSHCRAFLCDAYAGYDWLSKAGVLLCRCNAHSRRKFEQSLKENPTRSTEALIQYQLIYNVEDVIKRDGLTGKKKTDLRKRLAGPLWEEFKLWAASTLVEVPQNSLMAEACGYLLRHYDELTAYLNVPEMPMDNNRTEYEIRSMVLGKKNYLFCANDDSCLRAAMMYSFFGACRAVGANEVEWLTYVLYNIKDTPKELLTTLLPQNWVKYKKNHQA